MRKINFGFVILHYKVYKQTIRCIESIINNMINCNYFIVVVDNYSNNESIEKVEQKYSSNKNVKILKNRTNLGFANGNNVGIDWLNSNYLVDYVVVLNNDTQILNKKFENIIETEYEKSHFAVMGPKIILKDKTINPLCRQDVSLKRARKEKIYIRRQLVIKTFHLEKLVELIKKVVKKEKKVNDVMDVNKYYTNIVLHGSFLIFSKEYFSKYKGFDERTFLYHEEELLFLRLKKANLLSVYNPDLEIFHEEDAATNFSIPKERKRAICKLKNVYKSNKIVIKELKEMEKLK